MKKATLTFALTILAVVMNSAPGGAADTTLVSDSMTRVVSGGLGTSSAGAYSVTTPDQFSVDGAVGKVALSPGQERFATLAVTAGDATGSIRFAVSSIPAAGSGIYFAVATRISPAGEAYLHRVRIAPGGAAYASSVRWSRSTGSVAPIGSEVQLSTKIVAGTNYMLRGSVTGSSPVAAGTRVWPVGQPEPTSWQASGSDGSSARLIAGGGVGLWWYVSNSGATTSMTFDDFTVTTPSVPVVPAPGVGVGAGAALPITYGLGTLSGTIVYVSPSGSDSASGSPVAPMASVAAAVGRVASGGSATIVVRGGTYRQGNITVPSGRKVRLLAYPGEIPVFNGAQAFSSGWLVEGSLASHAYSAQPVTNGSGISFTSGQNLTGDAVGKFPDQAWVGSTQLRQVTAKSSVTAGKFWVDAANSRIYLAASDVAKGNVEASSQDRFLLSSAAGTTIEGLRITRFSPAANDGGVLQFGAAASASVLRNVEITESSFQAIQYTGSSSPLKGALLEDVTISGCNWMGIAASVVDDLVLRRAKITALNPFGEFTSIPQSGALKTSRNRGTKVLDSVISDNKSHGLWFDQSSADVDVVGNQLTGNTGAAVFFEISDDLLMANNFISGAADKAVRLGGSSGLKLINNTIVGGAEPVVVHTDARSIPGCADPSKPLCANSYSSDRDSIRTRPATLDWMPRIDMMINNVIAYPSGSGWCGAVPFCITLASGSATTTIEAVIHKADPTRGIPQTIISGNVYANGTNPVVRTTQYSYTSAAAFGSAIAATPIGIPGAETNSKTGNSWVNSDGSPTPTLTAAQSQATPIPTNSEINTYIPAGTRHYGHLNRPGESGDSKPWEGWSSCQGTRRRGIRRS